MLPTEPKYPIYELLKDTHLTGRELFGSSHKRFTYQPRGMEAILKSCANYVYTSPAKRTVFQQHFQEIVSVTRSYTSRVEMWATYMDQHTIGYPLEGWWFQIVKLTPATRAEVKRYFDDWRVNQSAFLARLESKGGK